MRFFLAFFVLGDLVIFLAFYNAFIGAEVGV
ncbi:hypothetical protein N577_011415 [Lacticaseibacillus rhamnosus 2166]|nr:hypothetical protein N577_011415 [Lacticaseibacillus rhamnosus 2166]